MEHRPKQPHKRSIETYLKFLIEAHAFKRGGLSFFGGYYDALQTPIVVSLSCFQAEQKSGTYPRIMRKMAIEPRKINLL